MAVSSFEELAEHAGHRVEVVTYGMGEAWGHAAENVAVECESCGVVLVDFDREAVAS